MNALELDAIDVAYGSTPILRGLSLTVGAGEVVSVLGRNGMGKTTMMNAITGFLPIRGGRLRMHEEDITRSPTHRRARAGLGLVPDVRRIYPSCTVREHLVMAARGDKDGGPWTLERIYSSFPVLEKRQKAKGGELSGGEQQMLAIARALSTNADVLLLDEPTEGLAPAIVDDIVSMIHRLKSETENAMVLVEQNLGLALSIADRVAVMNKGEVVFSGTPAEFERAPDVRDRYVGVG